MQTCATEQDFEVGGGKLGRWAMGAVETEGAKTGIDVFFEVVIKLVDAGLLAGCDETKGV